MKPNDYSREKSDTSDKAIKSHAQTMKLEQREGKYFDRHGKEVTREEILKSRRNMLTQFERYGTN